MGLWNSDASAPYVLRGKIKVGRSTKQLLQHIGSKKIAVLDHRDLDEMAAIGLIDAGVKGVINASRTMSGHYPTKGPLLLLDAGIPILEIAPEFSASFVSNAEIRADEKYIYTDRGRIPYTPFNKAKWEALNLEAHRNLGARLNDFIDNTLHYAKMEKSFVIEELRLPPIRTALAGKHVVVVVRGSGYKSDLQAIGEYIEDYRPVLIGVDGGADALIEYGFAPHMIVGDMDSISDRALMSGAEILVHAYPDGRAPGMQRIRRLGLRASVIPAPGTSEDVAMLMAYEKKAEMIVTLGTHTHMIDFLEKGRKGMASTILVRMKIGSRLVDAKGVSKLYHRPAKWKNVWMVPASALFPIVALAWIHPGMQHFFRMIWTYFKLSFR